MSDSFANLWNSSAPTKPPSPTKTLGGSLGTTSHLNGIRRPHYDPFSILASSGSSTPNSRSQTPSTLPSSSLKTAQKMTASNSSGGDAFSGLLPGSLGGASNDAGLSIAARTAKAEAEKRAALAKQQEVAQKQASAWAGLDSLGGLLSRSPPQPPTSQPNEDDWPFGPVVTSPSGTQSVLYPAIRPVEGDGRGLDSVIPRSQPVKQSPPVPSSQTNSIWDVDDFDDPLVPAALSHSTLQRTPSRSDTPGDFDFGDREDGLPGNDSPDEDDPLGILGKPVRSKPRRSSVATSTPRPSSQTKSRRSGPSSPPPHLIGRIVEMGFSPEQAHVALAATDSGEDVQAALETLLANAGDSSSVPPSVSRRPRRTEDEWGESETGRRFNYDDDSDNDRTPAQRRPSEVPRRHPLNRSQSSQQRNAASEGSYQQQADKLIAQASEIGLNVFNRANFLWKQGKEKAQKVYEERQAAVKSGSSTSRGPGRPRWLDEAVVKDQVAGKQESKEAPESSSNQAVTAPKPAQQQRRLDPQNLPSKPAETSDLLDIEPPTFYKSPFRRGVPSRTSTPPVAGPAPTRHTPSRAPLVHRQTISASASSLSASAKHKAAGTEMFKLGRYAEAETSYTSAISQLPESHLLLIPLLNNRAVTRLKTGDTSGVIEDCTAVISMIGPSYHPTREAKVMSEDHGSGVNLGESLVKAWRRRAEAYEAKEKWDFARQDWEAIVGVDFAGPTRKDAIAGSARCRKMVTAGSQPSLSNDPAGSISRPPAPTKAAPRSAPRAGPTPPSAALNRLKQANQEAEAEDQARHELKDSVDARLMAWKGGKESNIRALISSLENVLWPELGWQKVSMAELISPNQVKIRYTKAIAKLHPDKLNSKNTTVEQRMIANGVFGSLNDAWNAFQS